MLAFLFLFAVYGIVFMLQHKWDLEFLRSFNFFDRLLDCPYCLGFWVGGAVWNVVQTLSNLIMETNSILGFFFFGTLWSFASAGFCYLVDKVVDRYLEV